MAGAECRVAGAECRVAGAECRVAGAVAGAEWLIQEFSSPALILRLQGNRGQNFLLYLLAMSAAREFFGSRVWSRLQARQKNGL